MSSQKNQGGGNEFGRRLQSLREMRGLTQLQVGERAKMASASISHFETGQRIPSLESLVKLANGKVPYVGTIEREEGSG